MRALLRQVVAAEAHRAPDHLPPGLAQSLDLPSLSESFRHVHRPPPEADLDALNAGRSAWHKRLAFEEVFFFELQIALQRRRMTRQPAVACPEGGTIQRSLRRSLPFTLTGAQIRVLHEIGRDLATPHPMHRLLQGDVGSGKTVVALLACLQSIDAGCQSAVMAPTEILAVQHHHTMKALLGKSGVRAALLTSGTSKVERVRLLRGVSSGTISLLIGTHALLEDDVQFRKLGMVVVDEQHRFGVEQRLRLQAKGRGPEQPHVLVMTATPIPRSLALTVYGDLDLSVIDELPPGRVPAKTRHFVEKDRAKIYNAIREEGSAGRQVFVVYPLVSESEKLDLLDATRMAERLTAEFSEFNVGLIHGQMKSAEKDATMNQFKQGKIQVLVATTVIEVGIDIPNATLMVVEHAERFGLSQLHQLRGRIGRGVGRGRCFLLTPTLSRESEAARRMRIMVETHDGFKVAEHDLALRGPGALLGARQHGLPDFWTANLLSHRRLISDAREAARSIVSSDPEFSRPEHQGLEAGLRLHAGERLHGLRSG
jgi:ATP-dependent DNA helicase RecG